MSITGTPIDSLNAPDAFIFMKVGDHAGEGWKEILERKQEEIRQNGWTLWGYGGSACHPLTQVQPFMRSMSSYGVRPKLLMQYITSNADPRISPAREFSSDGIKWEGIPPTVVVTGSKYALIVSEIVPYEQHLALDDYEVGIGNSMGKRATDYLQGRIDKGCLVRSSSDLTVGEAERTFALANFAATLKDPYAVMLRP